MRFRWKQLTISIEKPSRLPCQSATKKTKQKIVEENEPPFGTFPGEKGLHLSKSHYQKEAQGSRPSFVSSIRTLYLTRRKSWTSGDKKKTGVAWNFPAPSPGIGRAAANQDAVDPTRRLFIRAATMSNIKIIIKEEEEKNRIFSLFRLGYSFVIFNDCLFNEHWHLVIGQSMLGDFPIRFHRFLLVVGEHE